MNLCRLEGQIGFWKRIVRHALGILLFGMMLSGEARAALPPGFTESIVAEGLNAPTAMAFAPDGRLFICEQAGRLRVFKNDVLLEAPFLSLSNVDAVGERGLLGVALDPLFASNGRIYVYYTVAGASAHNRLSRFTADESDSDVAAAGSEEILFELDPIVANNHNGGALHFGGDGKLYIAVGNNAVSSHSQNMETLFGKILRLNADGSIPGDNPFFATATGKNRAIWALGLRNPFTCAVQPETGRFFINDVGEASWEEINQGLAGANYGWPQSEGPTNDPRFQSPVFAYGHGTGATVGCSIAGGAFYPSSASQFPAAYAGKYFFADFCNDWIRVIDPASPAGAEPFASGNVSGVLRGIVGLGFGPDGMLYVLTTNRYFTSRKARLFRIRYSVSEAPAITLQPFDVTTAPNQRVSFTASASGSNPLSYQWKRNGVNIAGATAITYSIASPKVSDNGAKFQCVISNNLGQVISREATLTVTASAAPTGTISSPLEGAFYSAGETINYSGTATDPEDGILAPAAFSWRVDFHHGSHFHPFLPDQSGVRNGSFVVPTTGETATDVWYRLHLTVTDSSGVSQTSFRDILPRTVKITLQTNPANLQLTLDGQPLVSPAIITSVVGQTRSIGAVSPQALGGVNYAFSSWSDGGAQTHNLSVPATDTIYTAQFAPVVPPNPVNLSLSMTDSPDPVLVGRTLTYTLTVKNLSAVTATSVSVSDAIPAGLTFVSAISTRGTCNFASGVLTCDVGTLAFNASAKITLVVTPTTAGLVTNIASASSAQPDSNAANNSISQNTQVNIPPKPVFTKFSPTSGAVGAIVRLSGANFSDASKVEFNGTRARFLIVSSTEIAAIVPGGALTGPIAISNPGGTTASASSFVVTSETVPIIFGFWPPNGAAGTSVTLFGLNLSQITSVKFGSATASFAIDANTQITTTVPVAASTAKITLVGANGSASSAGNFTVAPRVSNFSPLVAPIGALLTISGANFSNVTLVKIGGVPARFTTTSSSRILATVPANAQNGPIEVTTVGGTGASTQIFAVEIPSQKKKVRKLVGEKVRKEVPN